MNTLRPESLILKPLSEIINKHPCGTLFIWEYRWVNIPTHAYAGQVRKNVDQ